MFGISNLSWNNDEEAIEILNKYNINVLSLVAALRGGHFPFVLPS